VGSREKAMMPASLNVRILFYIRAVESSRVVKSLIHMRAKTAPARVCCRGSTPCSIREDIAALSEH
jgi:hypothetical protein